MLSVILLILKIIGIILLVIIGLLLLVLLTILLVPIRYHIAVSHKEDIKVEGGARWLLYFAGVGFTYLEGIFHVRVRVLWFTLYDNLKPKLKKGDKQHKTAINSRHKKKDQKKTYSKKVIKKTKQSDLSINDNNKEDSEGSLSADRFPVKELRQNIEKKDIADENSDLSMIDGMIENNNTVQSDTETDHTFREQHKKSIFSKFVNKIKNLIDRMKSLKEKILSFFAGVKRKAIQWCKSMSEIRYKIGLISEFLKEEINKEGFQVTFVSLKKILKHILPTKLKSRIIFGTGDPCSTGQILGFMGILYSFYGDKIVVIPDFEHERLEGEHWARGRIRLITILITVIKLILDKRFKQLKNNFQILKEAL